MVADGVINQSCAPNRRLKFWLKTMKDLDLDSEVLCGGLFPTLLLVYIAENVMRYAQQKCNYAQSL